MYSYHDILELQYYLQSKNWDKKVHRSSNKGIFKPRSSTYSPLGW